MSNSHVSVLVHAEGMHLCAINAKKNMVNTRQKGLVLEKYVCEQIIAKGLDDRARPSYGSGSTTTEKADIWTSMVVLGQNAGIECKNHKQISMADWWYQTKKLESLAREPILVFKIHNAPLGDTLCTIYFDTFLEMAKEISELKKKLSTVSP